MDTLYIDTGAASSSGSIASVNVHPVVLFSVLDHHVRRGPMQDNVIGALLGTVTAGVVEVTNSFGVYHERRGEEEVLVRRQALYELLDLHKKINPKEVLVGWYSTWSGATRWSAAPAGGKLAEQHIDDFTLVVHDFFAEAASGVKPLHLLVDVSLRNSHVNTYAYQTVNNSLLKNVMVQFQQLRVNTVASTEERVGVEAMARSTLSGPGGLAERALELTRPHPMGDARELAPDIDALEAAMRRLKKLLDTTSAYVEDVVAGRAAGDEAVGRAITEALAAVPTVDPEAFERLLARNVQDVLVVTYLTTLAQTQLKLAERIATMPQA